MWQPLSETKLSTKRKKDFILLYFYFYSLGFYSIFIPWDSIFIPWELLMGFASDNIYDKKASYSTEDMPLKHTHSRLKKSEL